MNNPVIGMTSGCWDTLNYCHVKYLKRCKAVCDKLIVAVDCDEMVRKVKGKKRPTRPAQERRLMVDALECVDLTCIIENVEQLETISKVFCVEKVFKNRAFKDTPVVYGVYECPAELVIIPDVNGLEEK